jgi:peptidyl-prolyl cis-trans isomerase D
MATLQTIRDRAGILIAIVIGLALLAFVMGDFFGRGSGPGLRSKKFYEIAEIKGKSIPFQTYDQKIQNLIEIYKLIGRSVIDEATSENIREDTWQQLIREYVLEDEYKTLGITVCSDELFDLVQGNNPHPLIRQLFTDPQTGILNKSALIQFLKTLDNDPAQRAYWLFLENEILQDRTFTKYINLIRKGLYVNELQAEREYVASNKKADLSYIIQRFSSVPDSLITITQSDLEKYYKNHEREYKQTASRDIEYVAFEVAPSSDDISQSEDWINNIKKDFEESEETPQFINLSSDTPFDDINYKPDELPETIKEFILNTEIGEVYGPYFEDETYKLAKLLEINYLPDSVHARHILVSPNTEQNYEQAKNEADSLKRLIESGIDFAIIATVNSDDEGSAQLGGDLGWFGEGTMVKSFSDACFQGEKGDITVVESQFGFHIIEILDQGKPLKKYKIGILDRKVEPGSTTYQNVYAEASRFAGMNNTYEKFNSAIVEQGLEKRIANDLQENDKQIPGLESPRALIRAVYDSKEGEIVLDYNDQAIFELGNNFIVAYVTSVRKEGIAPLEQVRSDIEFNVRKEKKAEQITENLRTEIPGAESLEDLANKLDLIVEEASNISLNSFSIPGAGIEPAVIATAINSPLDTIAGPVTGNNGVYVIRVNNLSEPEASDFKTEKNMLINNYQARANYEAFEALKKIANIVDKRSKFY